MIYSKKRILVLLLVCVLMCNLAGCNSKTEKTDGEKTVSSNITGSEDVSSEENSNNGTESSESETNDTYSSEQNGGSYTDNTQSGGYTDNSSETSADNGYHTSRAIPVSEDDGEDSDEAAEEYTAETVSWNGPAGYVIVIPENDDLANEAASVLKSYFKKNAKVDLKVVTDSAKAVSKEIVIGSTNRYKYSAKDGEYFVKKVGEKLIFGGGHSVTAKKAAQIYSRLEYQKGKAYIFSETSDFTGTKLGYTYVWGDEFEGASLDTTRWNRSTKMSATSEMALDNTDLTTKTENGYLKMYALRYWDAKKSGVEYVVPWSVTTSETMSYKYGYVEIRAKVPFIRGVWPSFWASSSGALGPKRTYDYSIEVDIFEVFSSLDQLSPNIHKWYADGDHTMWAIDEGNSNEWYQFDSDNLVNEYHTYGFEWTPTEMTMYIDDEPYYTYDLTVNFDNGESGMGGFDTQIYLIFNNHLFTQSSTYKPYAGCEIRNTDLPAEYAIDWVRLYQKDDGKSKLYLAD